MAAEDEDEDDDDTTKMTPGMQRAMIR